MEDPNTQELFLIEFLVDRVNIPSVQVMHEDLLMVQTCIEFKILNLPAMYVSQDASVEKCTCLGDNPQIFRKGKSCLFALPCKLVERPLCSFPVVMTVYKKLPPTVLPDTMTIGSCEIETREMVNCLLQEAAPPGDNPSKTLKNNFRITTATGQCVGEVCLFLRVTRLGKKVVTQFQTPHNKRPYLFKGNVNTTVFQCKKVPSALCTKDDPLLSCVCPRSGNEDCGDEAPACCQVAPPTKKPKKPRRGCCQSGRKESKSSGHKNQTPECPKNPWEALFDLTEKPKRKCGCEITENKPSACGK